MHPIGHARAHEVALGQCEHRLGEVDAGDRDVGAQRGDALHQPSAAAAEVEQMAAWREQRTDRTRDELVHRPQKTRPGGVVLGRSGGVRHDHGLRGSNTSSHTLVLLRYRCMGTDVAAPAARIRDAALASYARDGAARTTVRRLAQDAGVSPGLVQHYFPAKSDLRSAVDDHVLALARDAFADVAPSVAGGGVIEGFGRRIATFVRDHPDVVRYVARSAFDEGAPPELFDGFVAIARAGWEQLAAAGVVRSDLDLTWSALHIVILNLGTVLFEDAIDRQLPDPLRTPAGLERWRRATTALFRSGAYRP